MVRLVRSSAPNGHLALHSKGIEKQVRLDAGHPPVIAIRWTQQGELEYFDMGAVISLTILTPWVLPSEGISPKKYFYLRSNPPLSAILHGRNQELQPHGLHKILLADIKTDEHGKSKFQSACDMEHIK